MALTNIIISTANNDQCFTDIDIIHCMSSTTTWWLTFLFKFGPFSCCYFLILRIDGNFEEPHFVAKMTFFILASKHVNTFFNTLTEGVMIYWLLKKSIWFHAIYILSDRTTLCLDDCFNMFFVIDLMPFVVLEIID